MTVIRTWLGGSWRTREIVPRDRVFAAIDLLLLTAPVAGKMVLVFTDPKLETARTTAFLLPGIVFTGVTALPYLLVLLRRWIGMPIGVVSILIQAFIFLTAVAFMRTYSKLLFDGSFITIQAAYLALRVILARRAEE